jgi:hypothetical protein
LKKQRVGDSPIRLLGFFRIATSTERRGAYGVDPDLPLGTLSRTTVPDALETLAGYAERDSDRSRPAYEVELVCGGKGRGSRPSADWKLIDSGSSAACVSEERLSRSGAGTGVGSVIEDFVLQLALYCPLS